jgi:tetratricopeptide (TPR) repeat protein
MSVLRHIWLRIWDRHAVLYGITLGVCSLATWAQLQYRISSNYFLVFNPVIGCALSLMSGAVLGSIFLDYWPRWDWARQFLKRIEWAVVLLVGLYACSSLLLYLNGSQDLSQPTYRFGEIIAYHRAPPVSSWWVEVRYRDDPGSVSNVILADDEYRELWGAEPICVTVKEGAYGIPIVLKIEKDWDSYSREILKLAPTAVGVWEKLIYFNLDRKRVNEAITDAQEFIKLNPREHEFSQMFGYALFTGGRRKDSIQFLEHAAAQHPDYDYYQALGTALSWTGERKRAAEVLEASIPLRPEDWEAYYHLGYVYRDMWRPQEAIAWFEKALERRSDFPEVRTVIAAIKVAMENNVYSQPRAENK